MKSIQKIIIIASLVIISLIAEAGINRGPLISSEEPHTHMYVNYRTDNSCISTLYHREIGTSTWTPVSDESSTNMHYIRLDILPYRNYEYYVNADGEETETYSFWSAPLPGAYEDFNFNAYGDSRTTEIAHVWVLNHMAENNPMFVLHSGDMIEDGEDNGQWDGFFTQICEFNTLGQTAPFFYAPGNHDDESSYYYDAVFLPRNTTEYTEAYFSFDWGRVHFLSINSELPWGYGSSQYTFIENDLAAASVNPNYDFIIAFIHRPFYSSGYHGREEDMADQLQPLLEEYNVDLVLQGHDHMYQRTVPMDGNVIYIVTGGGGAPPSPIFLWHTYTARGYNGYHHLNFIYSAITRTLKMYMYDYENEIEDSLILEETSVSVLEKKFDYEQEVRISPNPFSNICKISIPDGASIEIFDLMGKRIARADGFNQTQPWTYIWEPKSAIHGIYLAKIRYNNGKVSAHRLTYIE